MGGLNKGVFVLVALLVASSGAIRLSSQLGGKGSIKYVPGESMPQLVKQLKDACLVYNDQSSCIPCKSMAVSVVDEDFGGMRVNCKESADEVKDIDEAKQTVICHALSAAIAPSGASPFTVEHDGIVTEKTDPKSCRSHNAKVRRQNNFLMRYTFFDLLKEQHELGALSTVPDLGSEAKLSAFKAALVVAGEKKASGKDHTKMDEAVIRFCTAAKCCGDKTGQKAGIAANKKNAVEEEMAKKFPELQQEMRDREARAEQDRLEQERLRRLQEEKEAAARAKDEAAKAAQEQERLRKLAAEEEKRRQFEDNLQRSRSLSEESDDDEDNTQNSGNGTSDKDNTQGDDTSDEENNLLGGLSDDESDDEEADDECGIETADSGVSNLAQRLVKIPDEDSIVLASIKSVLKDVAQLFSCVGAREEKVIPDGQLRLEDLVYVQNEDAEDEGDQEVVVSAEQRDAAKAELTYYPELIAGIEELVAFATTHKAFKRCQMLEIQFDEENNQLHQLFNLYVKAKYSKGLPAGRRNAIMDACKENVSFINRQMQKVFKALKTTGKKQPEARCSGIYTEAYSTKVGSVKNVNESIRKMKAALNANQQTKSDSDLPAGSELRFKQGKMIVSGGDGVEAQRNNFFVLRRVIFMVHAALSLLSETKPRLSYVLYMDRDIDALFKLEAQISKIANDDVALARMYPRFLRYLKRGGGNVMSASPVDGEQSGKEQLIVNVWDAGSTKSAVNMFMAIPAEGASTFIKKGEATDGASEPLVVSAREAELERAASKNRGEDLAKVAMQLDRSNMPSTTGALENNLDHDFEITERGMYTMPGISCFLDCDHGCPENYEGGSAPKWTQRGGHYTLSRVFSGGAFWPKWLIENYCPRPRCPDESEFMAKSLGDPQRFMSRCYKKAKRESSNPQDQMTIAKACANDAVALTSRLHLSPASKTYEVLKTALTGSRKISGARVCNNYKIESGGPNVVGEYNLMTMQGYVRMMWNIITTKSKLAKEAEGAMSASEKILVVSTAGMRIGMSYCPKRTVSKIRTFESYLGECATSNKCGDNQNSEFVGYSMQNGKIEALNGWITTNQLSKIIDKSASNPISVSKLRRGEVPPIIPEEADLSQDSPIHIELGGGSAQVAFMTDRTSYDTYKSEMGAPEYLATTETETEMPLYRFSLLYYGAEYAKHSQEDIADQSGATTYCYQPGLNAAEQNTAMSGLVDRFKARDESQCAQAKECSRFSVLPARSDAHCCLLPAGAVRPGSAARQTNIDTTVTDPAERFAKCYEEIDTKVVDKCAQQDIPAKEFNKVSDVKVKPHMMKSDGSQRDVIMAGGGMYYPMRALIRIFLCSNLAVQVLESPWIESGLMKRFCFRESGESQQTADIEAVQALLGSDSSLLANSMDADIKNVIDDYVKSTLAMRAELGDFADRLEDFTQPIMKVKISTMYKMNSKFCASNHLYKAAYIMGHPSFAKQLSSICFSNTFNMYMLTSVFGIKVTAEDVGEDPVDIVKNNDAEVMFTMGVLRKFDDTEGPKWYPNRWSAGAAARYVSAQSMAQTSKVDIEALGDPESDKAKALMEMKINHKRSAAKAAYESDRFQETGVNYESVLGSHTPAQASEEADGNGADDADDVAAQDSLASSVKSDAGATAGAAAAKPRASRISAARRPDRRRE